MSRKRFSERETIATLIHQGGEVLCFRCKQPFFLVAHSDLGLANELYNRHHISNMEREHLHEIALGGPDTPENCRYSCAWSHSQVTNGTLGTVAGSSKHRIAKSKGTRAAKFAVQKLSLDKKRDKAPRYGNTTFGAKR